MKRAKMQVKVFMGSSAEGIETQLNAWLSKLDGAVIKTETHVSAIGDQPSIVTIIWYEPTSD